VRFLDDKTVLVNDFFSVANKKFVESPTYLNSLALFRNIFKGIRKEVVPVKCADLAKEGGVLNCVSWN
jgi:hypothetical protein